MSLNYWLLLRFYLRDSARAQAGGGTVRVTIRLSAECRAQLGELNVGCSTLRAWPEPQSRVGNLTDWATQVSLNYCLSTLHSIFTVPGWNSKNYNFLSLAGCRLASTTSSSYLKRMEGERKEEWEGTSSLFACYLHQHCPASWFQSPVFLFGWCRQNKLHCNSLKNHQWLWEARSLNVHVLTTEPLPDFLSLNVSFCFFGLLTPT